MNNLHERPGVYSVYDTSSVLSGGRAARTIGVAARAAKGEADNTAWYETTAMGYPGVTAAKAVGRAEGPGTVNVYVTGENGLPGEELLAGLQAELQEKREIAVTVKALAPTSRTVNVSVQVAPREGADRAAVLEAARQAITDFFSGRLLGRAVLLAELGSKLYSLEGVENYRFTAPAEDLPADSTVLPVLGTLRVTAMEG